MDTKSPKSDLPENIQKLLESAVDEDIMLGLMWAYNNKGIKWCIDNFDYYPEDNNHGNFPINKSRQNKCFGMKFPDLTILVGEYTIEARSEEDDDFLSGVNILYDETT